MLPLGAFASVNVTSPTGLMRLSTRASESSVAPGLTPMMSCESRTTSAIGTAKASTTTTISCFGVLMKEVCSSLIALIAVLRAVSAKCGPLHRAAKQSAHYNASADEPSGRCSEHRGRIVTRAPVAQLDRVLVSEAKGHRFDSCRALHFGMVCSGHIGNVLYRRNEVLPLSHERHIKPRRQQPPIPRPRQRRGLRSRSVFVPWMRI